VREGIGGCNLWRGGKKAEWRVWKKRMVFGLWSVWKLEMPNGEWHHRRLVIRNWDTKLFLGWVKVNMLCVRVWKKRKTEKRGHTHWWCMTQRSGGSFRMSLVSRSVSNPNLFFIVCNPLTITKAKSVKWYLKNFQSRFSCLLFLFQYNRVCFSSYKLE